MVHNRHPKQVCCVLLCVGVRRCFNPVACQNNYTRLLELHPYRNITNPILPPSSSPALLMGPSTAVTNVSTSSSGAPSGLSTAAAAYLAAQCAEGYTGTMCATCQPGYGMTRQFSCSKCLPPQAVAVVYTIGALVLMVVIRVMMHLSTTSDSVGTKMWTAAALASSPLLPQATAGPSRWAESAAGRAGVNRDASTMRAAATPDGPISRIEMAPAASVAAQQKLVPALPSSVLKVLVLYMQYILIIAGMPVQWPPSLSGPFTALAGLWSGASSEALAVECLMPSRWHPAADPAAAEAPAASSAGTAVPVSVLRTLLYVVVPIAMYAILVVVECLWRASRPWLQAACRRYMVQHGAHVGGFVPGFARWHQARHQVRGAPTPEPAGCEEEEAYTNLEGAANLAPLPTVNNNATGAQAMPAGRVGGFQGYLPSAAWCGVLAMVIIFFFLTSLARATLGLFICYTLEEDPRAVEEKIHGIGRVSLWMYDMSQPCFGPEHKRWALGLGIPLVVLIFGCLPVVVGVLLCRWRHQLTDTWVQGHFGFLYVHYRPAYYLWEVVVILQTFIVVVVSVTANYLGVYNQALLLNVVLAVIFTMLLLFKPMASREVQLLNYVSIGVQLFTTYAALSFISASESAIATAVVSQDPQSIWGFTTYKVVMGVLVLVANLAFIIGLVLVLLMTLPSVFWQSWRVFVLRQWRALRVSCRHNRRHSKRAPLVAVAHPMLSARTPSGHPVLVRLDAHKQVQLTPGANVVSGANQARSCDVGQ